MSAADTSSKSAHETYFYLRVLEEVKGKSVPWKTVHGQCGGAQGKPLLATLASNMSASLKSRLFQFQIISMLIYLGKQWTMISTLWSLPLSWEALMHFRLLALALPSLGTWTTISGLKQQMEDLSLICCLLCDFAFQISKQIFSKIKAYKSIHLFIFFASKQTYVLLHCLVNFWRHL